MPNFWGAVMIQVDKKSLLQVLNEFKSKICPSFPFSPTAVFMGEGQRGGNTISMKTH